MSRRGRFGKYGESKRLNRLREARIPLPGRPGKTEPCRERQRCPKPAGKTADRILLRQADFSDAAFVRSLSKQAFARYGPYEKLLPEWLLSGMTVTLIAWLGKKPIGFVMMGRPLHNGWRPEVSEILAIAVERSRQGAGIGDHLLAEALARAGSLGIETLALHTSVDNKPAQGLFEKHGFQPAEIKPHFYPEGQDALLMERTLP